MVIAPEKLRQPGPEGSGCPAPDRISPPKGTLCVLNEGQISPDTDLSPKRNAMRSKRGTDLLEDAVEGAEGDLGDNGGDADDQQDKPRCFLPFSTHAAQGM